MLQPLARRLPEPLKAPLRKQIHRHRARTAGPPPPPPTRRELWERDGYLVLEGLFDKAEARWAAAGFDHAWATRREHGRGLVIDAFVTGEGGTPRRMHLADAPDEAREQVYKLNDMYLVDDLVRSMVLAEPLVSAMRDLVGDDVVAINSLHFERGSSQQYHVDTYYMPPPTGGQLIVSSICLEDVHPDAGPLQYFPRSHRVPPYLNSDGDRRARNVDELADATAHFAEQCAHHGLEEAIFCGKAGDTFLWHEQLLHGGRGIADMRRTRRSIVTHYWTKSSMAADAEIVPYGAGFYLRRPPQHVEP